MSSTGPPVQVSMDCNHTHSPNVFQSSSLEEEKKCIIELNGNNAICYCESIDSSNHLSNCWQVRQGDDYEYYVHIKLYLVVLHPGVCVRVRVCLHLCVCVLVTYKCIVTARMLRINAVKHFQERLIRSALML